MAACSESSLDNSQNSDFSFVWDETSHLYFHASSGFYYDPNAKWYYSTRDGLYYKYENGNYVLLHSDSDDKSEIYNSGVASFENSTLEEPVIKRVSFEDNENGALLNGVEAYANQCTGNGQEEPIAGNSGCGNMHSPENPPPPSEWLEDTLIELYLSGYSNQDVKVTDDVTTPLQMDECEKLELPSDGNTDAYDLEEGEWFPEDYHGITETSENVSEEGASWDEENWKAQYGQVIRYSEEPIPLVPVMDLWDWALVKGSKKDGKGEVMRLVGRLMRKSAKLHPSMPSGGCLLRTAPICEVHHDLVRVKTGQIYKLQSPSARFLASLSVYDSSNPTKDWGFPELSLGRQLLPLSKSNRKSESETVDEVSVGNDLPLRDHVLASDKSREYAYRDRAAERRALHGGFGVGPGQKNSIAGPDDFPASTVSGSTEEAAAEALNMSFGAGSYARRILENMGWKQGEALGKTTKGLVEPIQAEGNIGNAGLGWPRGRSKPC
ncbi:hypothetical protein UlMin_008400 [Ulmus minor]